ncbi:MAG TPA: hypothetical protein VFX19_11985 [Dehalococcoidia bacterium]|nr:hypothetical protein [Dehalococcoidia bacterium]
MEFDLSAPESQLLEQLLQERREKLVASGNHGDDVAVVDKLIRKLVHPMRGGIDQSDSALMSDIGDSIAPEIPFEERMRERRAFTEPDAKQA